MFSKKVQKTNFISDNECRAQCDMGTNCNGYWWHDSFAKKECIYYLNSPDLEIDKATGRMAAWAGKCYIRKGPNFWATFKVPGSG